MLKNTEKIIVHILDQQDIVTIAGQSMRICKLASLSDWIEDAFPSTELVGKKITKFQVTLRMTSDCPFAVNIYTALGPSGSTFTDGGFSAQNEDRYVFAASYGVKPFEMKLEGQVVSRCQGTDLWIGNFTFNSKKLADAILQAYHNETLVNWNLVAITYHKPLSGVIIRPFIEVRYTTVSGGVLNPVSRDLMLKK